MSLRDKTAAIMVGVILLFGLWITSFTWMTLTRILTGEHQSQGIIVSRNISRQRVGERTRELKQAQARLIQSGKLAALGELGAGWAKGQLLLLPCR